MDDLARVIAEAHGYDWEDFSADQRKWHRKAANAVRTYLESDEVVERMAKAHCDYFGGEGWWELGLLADTLPEGRKAMRAALNAAGGKQT